MISLDATSLIDFGEFSQKYKKYGSVIELYQVR